MVSRSNRIEGDDHSISENCREAIQRTVAFFDQYLK